MTLVVVTVVVVGLLVAALAIYLFKVGVLLYRTADNLADCLQSLRTIAEQAEVVGPGIMRINKAGTELLGAMPLLIEGAGAVAAKLGPSTATESASPAATAAPAADTPAESASDAIKDTPTGKGYLDAATTGVGYLDVS